MPNKKHVNQTGLPMGRGDELLGHSWIKKFPTHPVLNLVHVVLLSYQLMITMMFCQRTFNLEIDRTVRVKKHIFLKNICSENLDISLVSKIH